MADGVARDILRLSAGAFVALITEPLFLLADSAIVGHLGTPQLAALGIATAVLGALVSVCIFLAYGTTASVAQYLGAGRRREALTQGVDGLWLAVLIGALVTAVAWPLTGRIVGWFGPGALVAGYAASYLRVAWFGTVPVLVMLAGVGVLRGVKDVRTPLVVAVVANLANIVLNLILVYGLAGLPRLGIAGSATGSLIAQLGAGAAVGYATLRFAHREGARLVPDLGGVLRAAGAGVPLIVRTVMLRIAMLLMTYAAARIGDPQLATMQLALSIWSFLANILDALGISAQTLVGGALGSGDDARTRALGDRFVRWGFGYGLLTGLLLVACAGGLGGLFTSDPQVRQLLPAVLLVAALAQPVAGIVFALDGVLIGAGDGRYLAIAQTIVLAVFAPAVAWTLLGDHGLTWLWACFAIAFMGARGVLLVGRLRTDAWLRTSLGRALE